MNWFFPLGNKKKHFAQNDAGELIISGNVSGGGGSGIGSARFIAQRFGNLDANSGEVFVYDNLQTAVTLDYLEFNTNSPDQIRFRIYHGVSRLASMRSDGITVDEFTLEKVINNATGFFDILEYNPSVDLYKVRFNIKEFKCPEGLRISVINDSPDTEYRCGVYAFGRVM